MSPDFESLIMKRLLAYFGRLLFVLCLVGHGVSASAFASQNTCVDEETLKGFYEKFSLLEKEKEALRTKLSTCSIAGEQAAELSVTLSQKDGRQLRYLESKVTQLEEENGKLRDKLIALGALPDEALSGEVNEEASESLVPDKDANTEVPAAKVSEPVADEPLEGPVLPAGGDAEAEPSDPGLNNSAAPPAETPDDAPPAPEDKKSDIVPEPASPSAPELIETGSGGPESAATIAWNILKNDPIRTEAAAPIIEKSAYEEGCALRYQAFEKTLLGLTSVQSERKTLQELSEQHRRLISSSEEGTVLCPDQATSTRVSETLERLERTMREAATSQQAIQILYYENRKLESGG